MEAVTNLSERVAAVIGEYASASPNATLYHLHDAQQGIDAVVVVPQKRQKPPYIVVMTRLDGDHVRIESDTTDRPLEEALIAAGIPRSQIILAYRGEGIAVT